jgi:hypothetical protein
MEPCAQKAKPRQRPRGVSDGGEIDPSDMAYPPENATPLKRYLQQNLATNAVQPTLLLTTFSGLVKPDGY